MHKPVSKVREAKLELYRQQGKIHARAVAGRFNSLRWALVWLTQTIFYGACWLRWDVDGGSRQAILFDVAHERLYLFGLVLWPQDAPLLALDLIGAASALFLVTALAGRLFCGFLCPQTVYTAIFVWIEAKVEGDHLARVKLDRSPRGVGKLLRKGLKHGIWALVALWTAITFVGYFTPVRELLAGLAELRCGPWEAFWLIFYGAFTYVQAGLAREAVCQHMCPYSRFQGVMFDRDTASVAYDRRRGEPRSVRRDKAGGDCIDCGLCIDACDQVMDRVGTPRGLIRFATERALAGGAPPPGMVARPRVAVYAALLLVVVALGYSYLAGRSLLRVDVLRDRGALLRETAEGRIENAYTLKLTNLDEAAREYRVAVSGLDGLEIVGSDRFAVPAATSRPVSLTLSAPAGGKPSGIRPIVFEIVAGDDPASRLREQSSFALP